MDDIHQVNHNERVERALLEIIKKLDEITFTLRSIADRKV